MIKNILISIGVGTVIIIVLFLEIIQEDMIISDFLKERGKIIKSKESFSAFPHGPFLYQNDMGNIYKVETTDGHIYWFRTGGLLGPDIEEEINGEYSTIK